MERRDSGSQTGIKIGSLKPLELSFFPPRGCGAPASWCVEAVWRHAPSTRPVGSRCGRAVGLLILTSREPFAFGGLGGCTGWGCPVGCRQGTCIRWGYSPVATVDTTFLFLPSENRGSGGLSWAGHGNRPEGKLGGRAFPQVPSHLWSERGTQGPFCQPCPFTSENKRGGTAGTGAAAGATCLGCRWSGVLAQTSQTCPCQV